MTVIQWQVAKRQVAAVYAIRVHAIAEGKLGRPGGRRNAVALGSPVDVHVTSDVVLIAERDHR